MPNHILSQQLLHRKPDLPNRHLESRHNDQRLQKAMTNDTVPTAIEITGENLSSPILRGKRQSSKSAR